MVNQLVTNIRQGLAENANREKATGMRAYMKSAMPYRGVQTPIRRKLVRAALRAHPLASRDDWLAAVLDLWRNAAYREERYAAQDVSGAPQFRAFRTLEALPLYEEMVVNGAWWDLVDDVATHKLRELVDHYPEEMAAHMRAWSRDADLWKRRSSIICQVKRKEATDLALTLRLHRTKHDRSRFLHPQSHRLGAARPGLDRSANGRGLRFSKRQPPQRPIQA